MTKTEIMGAQYKMKFMQYIYPPYFSVFNKLPSGVQIILPRIITEQIYTLLKNCDWRRFSLDCSMPSGTFCSIKCVI